MVTGYDGADESLSTPETAMVDPRAPRFGQALTATGLLGGVLFDLPLAVFAIATILVVAVASQWRLDLYGFLFKTVVRPFLDQRSPESATPHRFAKVVGAVGTSIASGLLLAGFTLAGYLVAVPIIVAAGLGATTGFCLGCHMYRQVSLFRRLSIV